MDSIITFGTHHTQVYCNHVPPEAANVSHNNSSHHDSDLVSQFTSFITSSHLLRHRERSIQKRRLQGHLFGQMAGRSFWDQRFYVRNLHVCFFLVPDPRMNIRLLKFAITLAHKQERHARKSENKPHQTMYDDCGSDDGDP